MSESYWKLKAEAHEAQARAYDAYDLAEDESSPLKGHYRRLATEYRGMAAQARKHSIDHIDNDGNYEPGNVRPRRKP